MLYAISFHNCAYYTHREMDFVLLSNVYLTIFHLIFHQKELLLVQNIKEYCWNKQLKHEIN